jgi:glycosyltransferase involved in cell wall biosynthesis
MRILHVAEAFGGGLLEMVTSVANGSVEAGHPVAIAYGRRPETPGSLTELVSPDVELFELPWGRRTPREELRAGRLLRAAATAWRPDVIHLHSSVAGAVGTAALHSRAPTIYTPHSFESTLPSTRGARRLAIRLVERAIVRRATLVGAVSPSEARLARELHGGSRVTVVENGIPELEPEGMVERGLPASATVVAVGRTVPQRRPEACARILDGLRDIAEVQWIGGGGGDRGVAGRRALEAAGVPITGWVPHAEVLERLGAVTAYLHWTAWDGQPLSVLEAMARDAVVVASDIEPNRDVLGPEQVFRSEADAVRALRRVVLDRDHAEKLRRSQRERRGRWAAGRMVEDWLRVYRKLGSD